MSRGTRATPHHELDPDPKYGSVTVSKLINYVMKNGKKLLAQRIVYTALEQAAAKLDVDGLTVLEGALKNITPVIEVRGRRVGGANLQVPIEVPKNRRLMLALRWMLTAARSAKGRPMADKLTTELINAYNGEGAAVKRREEVHRMAEANRAFAHFAKRSS